METPAEKTWSAAQGILRTMLNPDIYGLWFGNIRAVAETERGITLEVANDFCEVWLKENYLDLLRQVLAHVTGRQIEIQFALRSSAPAAAAEKEGKPVRVNGRSMSAEPAASRAVRLAPDRDEALFGLQESPFNPSNTFDTFVVGSNNSFAHAAALAVAKGPGKSYNPLFVYGGVGLGKTHLLHAIGQHVASHKKGARVAYLSSERFTNEFINALQTNQLVRFRKKYRQTDVLLIDDIQFLANKERIQEEFFHTFNALHETHKQIVLTCDRPAGEIQNLEHRLVSRFEWGLVTDLQPPDVETRVAILRRKGQSLGAAVPEEVVNFLASRIRTNIRRLEGALIRVASYASLTGRTLTVDLVEELLREVLHEEGRYTLTIESIQKKVAEHYDIRLADMTSKRRPENIAFPRQVAMYLARQLTENSLSVIGEAFGGRDHGTVLHACRLVRNRMDTEDGVRQVVSHLEKQLQR